MAGWRKEVREESVWEKEVREVEREKEVREEGEVGEESLGREVGGQKSWRVAGSSADVGPWKDLGELEGTAKKNDA